MLIVHCKTFVPTTIAVTPVVGNVGVVIVTPPEINVHDPVPIAGIFPASVVVPAQTVWFGPAFEIVGFASR